jgi:uncharacterized protein (DUF488 family)
VSTTVWTIGHSVRPIADFIEVLQAYDIELIADVRRFPGSRRMPQYSAEALEVALAAAGIAYQWLPSLGGRRRPDPDSANTGWRHAAFRAYADHIATEEFARGLFELLLLARGMRTCVMCAEILWWRCHRRILADVLTVLGCDVIHIREKRAAAEHRLGPPARLVRGCITYEAQ